MSRQATFRFYEELNDFLPAMRKKKAFTHSFTGTPSVKDAIESLGVPHTEVDLILVNGRPVDFSSLLTGGEYISVYPCFESLDISGVTGLHDRGLRISRFILDVHLGKLARYLRLFGFDTVYEKDYDDREIARRSVEEKRILLTRDVGLLKHKDLTHGYWLRSQQPMTQLQEVLDHFDLYSQAKPFSRCMACNGIISPVSRQEVEEQIPPLTGKYVQAYSRCTRCGKIYWEGSHYERMRDTVARVLGRKNSSDSS
ncbi:MAG TPA: twitching motility protein PilT [Bacteroidetes bacterium]|nr:twitching motility protein PilT [Bacteroidota bacterium]